MNERDRTEHSSELEPSSALALSGDAKLARRKLLQNSAWVVPAIVSTAAVSARAASGTGGGCNPEIELCP